MELLAPHSMRDKCGNIFGAASLPLIALSPATEPEVISSVGNLFGFSQPNLMRFIKDGFPIAPFASLDVFASRHLGDRKAAAPTMAEER
jgi:hypothetical protein